MNSSKLLKSLIGKKLLHVQRYLFVSDYSFYDPGTKIPFQDLLIGATALHLGYALVTGNPRHFQVIPDLVVKQL